MDSLPINGLDIAVIVVLLVSALLAFMRGFVHEILSIGAWVGAVLCAMYGLPYVRPFANDLIPFTWAADGAAAIALFLIGLLVLSLITNTLSKSVKASALNALDRSLGFLFGLARAAVILAIMLMVGDWLMGPDKRPDWMQSAKTLPLIQITADGIKQIIPDQLMAAEDATKDAAGTAKGVIELKDTFDRLTQPTPESGDGAPDGAYSDKERRDMERLLQGTSIEDAGKALMDSGLLTPQQQQAAQRLMNDPALQARARAEAQKMLSGGKIDPAKAAQARELLAKSGLDPSIQVQIEQMISSGSIDPSKAQEIQRLLQSQALPQSGAAPQ
ncbi:MAG: CvpA family protein [Rhodobacteraceae bacterium]|nr:CvpA family protein [Paracoccaceae bacterium]